MQSWDQERIADEASRQNATLAAANSSLHQSYLGAVLAAEDVLFNATRSHHEAVLAQIHTELNLTDASIAVANGQEDVAMARSAIAAAAAQSTWARARNASGVQVSEQVEQDHAEAAAGEQLASIQTTLGKAQDKEALLVQVTC